ncbi:PhoPQ-activated protein PqaA family protein [Lysobacter firmicutimachus]|uniref:PhoPQ-activated protein PqaA family protein n=1 Tax=Lysobacter firmicutimachus TaxID=1792846 RepID=A0AAU8MNK2_9GAMM
MDGHGMRLQDEPAIGARALRRWGARLALFGACVCASAAISAQPQTAAPAQDSERIDYSEVWPDYRQRQSRLPLRYESLGSTALDGVEKRSYRLISQSWPENGGAVPSEWTHRVDLYLPAVARPKTALLVINNGINTAGGSDPVRPPGDFDEALALEVARTTQTIVVSVSDLPNQYLTLPGDSVARKEDVLVAATWRRFLDAPAAHATLPLHVPMAEGAVRAMDLAERELRAWRVRSFVITGASKRAWAAWLTAVADPRAEALVSYVIDLRIAELMQHINRVYGGGWPIALLPYHQEGITARYREPAFARMMQVEDAYRYLATRHRHRLRLPKYLISASGDDFFPPDAQRLYVDALPGTTALRAAPNADHGGVRRHMRETLIPALQRFHRGAALPQVRAALRRDDDGLRLSAQASERPVSATLWQADNPTGRDFRYACGIRYRDSALALRRNRAEVPLAAPPAGGWSAAFVEFRFADGFVATTPVYVYPEERYPDRPPANGTGACLTIPQ